MGIRLFGTKQYINENSIFIGDKAKGRISRQVTRKQSSPNFPKNERFLENLVSFVFLLAPSWDMPFCCITNILLFYYICFMPSFGIYVIYPHSGYQPSPFLSKIPPLFFVNRPSLKSENCPSPPFSAIPPIYCFFVNQPKNHIFQWTPIILIIISPLFPSNPPLKS